VAGATGVLVAAFVILDLFSYAMHRLEYRIEFLWRLHAVHHADPIVDASTGVRQHPGKSSRSPWPEGAVRDARPTGALRRPDGSPL